MYEVCLLLESEIRTAAFAFFCARQLSLQVNVQSIGAVAWKKRGRAWSPVLGYRMVNGCLRGVIKGRRRMLPEFVQG